MLPSGTRNVGAALVDRARPTIETKDAPSEDHLLEVISDIEARLSHIRASQAERSRLESELVERSTELAEREGTLSERELMLLAEEKAIQDRASLVDREQEALERQRREFERRLREVQERQAELEARERNTESLAGDIEAERREIAALQQALEQQHTDIGARESLLRAQVESLDNERKAIDSTRSHLELERAALQETARRQAEQSRQLKALAQDLSRREQEFSQRMDEYDQLREKLDLVAAELTSTRAQAEETAEQARSEQARSAELTRRCRELEDERERIRLELTKTKRERDTAAHAAPAPRQLAPRSRAPHAVVLWIVVSTIGAMAAILAVGGAALSTYGTIFGMAFAVAVVGSQAIGRRLGEASYLPVAAFFGAIGLWFGDWVNALGTALATWDLPEWLLMELNGPQLPLGLAVLTAGLVANAALYTITSSEAVMGQVFFGTLLATTLVMMPNAGPGAMAFAGIAWLSIAAASLARWSVRSALRTVSIESRSQANRRIL
ncbi:MAG: hypothetical protein KF866_02295 [Phycisphaeraceae bacterium]|nr:hypothetical protein [Phycisphaeraceae bacterium]MCW5753476.1 hypothetical protein [Phycisphaeraceae bacterium]